LVFYHFGSVVELLLAALDDVSARRLAAYADVVDQARTITDLIDSAHAIFGEDLDAGHVAVLVEMITGAQSTPGLGEQVAARLAPWRDAYRPELRQNGLVGNRRRAEISDSRDRFLDLTWQESDCRQALQNV
jgi:hypothetical protein